MSTLSTRYREGRGGRGVVLLAVFLLLWALNTTLASLGWVFLDALNHGWGLAESVEMLWAYMVFMAFGIWLPSAVLTAAWAGWVGGAP